MHHFNMIPSFPLVSGLLIVIINVVVGEIDLLADPGVINLDHGALTLDDVINDIDLLKETNYEYDTLQDDDDLISTIELVDDDVVDGVVTVSGGVDSDGDIIIGPPLALPGDDISDTITADAVDGEGPAAGAEVEEAEATTITAKNVQTTRTTDPRLERFAEQLELITLSPDARKRRKIEFQLQKISVQNTEEQERKRQERKQRRLEKREKKKLEKLEKKKEKANKIKNSKMQERKTKDKKNDVINLLAEINDGEGRIQNFNFFEDKNWVNRKLKSFNKAKEKGSKKEKKNIPKENKLAPRKTKKLEKSDGKNEKKEQLNLENIEKRKAKLLSKGKDRNLRILQRMIEKEENRLPLMTKNNDRNLQSRKIDRNRVDYQRKKRDLKVLKSMKEKLTKRKKEIRFLLRLKRGFGARLDNERKKEVAQQLMQLKRKYSNDKKKLNDFQKNNWELIEESKLYSKLNRLKKKISYLNKKKKQHATTPKSNYVIKLSKRIDHFQKSYEETKKKIGLMGKFNAKFENHNSKHEKRNPHGNYLKRQTIKSKIKALRKIESQIDNDSDSEYKLKLKQKIKVLVEKFKKYRRRDKIRNETKKEKKTRQLKEKIKRLEKKRKKGVDLVTETKLVKVRDDLIKRYKKMRSIIGYERRNKCYLRDDLDSKKFLRMQNIKEAIETLKDQRKQIKSKEHRTKITNTIKRLYKSYKNYKRLEKNQNETKTERKNTKLREEILSLMKIKKKSKDQNAKINLGKKIKKLVEKYKKTRKIIKYENKYECRFFRKATKIKEKIKILRLKRRQTDDSTDYNVKIRLTNKIRHLNELSRKYRNFEKERNESENERKLRELKEEIKRIVKVQRSSDDINTKTKLAMQVKNLKEIYKSIYLKVKYQSRNKDLIRKSYERRTISKYYTIMENLKDKIKSLIKMKKQIRNEVDPRYKIKLNESIKQLANMYKKYKRLEKIKTETKKEKKSRKMKEKIRSLKLKMDKSTKSKSKGRISNVISGLTERYKKVHKQVRYEKINKCYLREDYTSMNYLKMEKLKEKIKSLINERRSLGSRGDPKQRLNLKRKIKALGKKYKTYRRKVKESNETKNEMKNRILKEKIRDLMRLKKQTEDQNIKIKLSNKMKRLLKHYKKMRKIIRYENEYECMYFKRVQKLKEKAKALVRIRKQIRGDNEAKQKDLISKRITNLMGKYKKYNHIEKARKESENGGRLRKLKEEIKSLLTLRKNTPDINKKKDLSKKISTLKNIYKNLRLIVKYEEKDMEQISRSYDNRIKSRHYVKMQKLKPKIISLRKENRQISNKEDSADKLELRNRVTSLIKRYENHKRLIGKKHHGKNRKSHKIKQSPRNKHIARKQKDVQQKRKHTSPKNIYKKEDTAKRKRQQRKLRLRRRREKRGRVSKKEGYKDSTRKRIKSGLLKEDRGGEPVLPEGMAYCKSKETKSGSSCQCWYLQEPL